MINRFIGVGRLVADPELKYTPSGLAVCRFKIAINRTFKTDGQQEADFINCVAWRKQAENLSNYMKKGNLIGLEGRIQTGSYEGQDGKRVYTTEIVADSIQFLEPKNSAGGSQVAPNTQGQPNTYQQQQNGAQGNYSSQTQQNYTNVDEDPFANSKSPVEVSEDDLPF